MTRRYHGDIVTVYRPQQRLGGLLSTAILAARDIFRSRHLIWKLFERDFKAQFRQKILGYLWAALTPLLAIASFVILNLTGVLNPGDTGVPYPIYVFVGTGIWSFLTTTMTSVSDGLLKQSDLILRTNIPKIALAVSSLAQIIYNLLVHLILLMFLLFLFGTEIHPASLLYVVLILPMILLGVTIGLVLSVVGAIARDLISIAQSGLAFLMYLTPVVYVAKSLDSSLIQTLIWYNPLSYLIEVPRAVLLNGSGEVWVGYWLSSGLVIVLLFIAIRCFYVVQDLVAERL